MKRLLTLLLLLAFAAPTQAQSSVDFAAAERAAHYIRALTDTSDSQYVSVADVREAYRRGEGDRTLAIYARQLAGFAPVADSLDVAFEEHKEAVEGLIAYTSRVEAERDSAFAVAATASARADSLEARDAARTEALRTLTDWVQEAQQE